MGGRLYFATDANSVASRRGEALRFVSVSLGGGGVAAIFSSGNNFPCSAIANTSGLIVVAGMLGGNASLRLCSARARRFGRLGCLRFSSGGYIKGAVEGISVSSGAGAVYLLILSYISRASISLGVRACSCSVGFLGDCSVSSVSSSSGRLVRKIRFFSFEGGCLVCRGFDVAEYVNCVKGGGLRGSSVVSGVSSACSVTRAPRGKCSAVLSCGKVSSSRGVCSFGAVSGAVGGAAFGPRVGSCAVGEVSQVKGSGLVVVVFPSGASKGDGLGPGLCFAGLDSLGFRWANNGGRLGFVLRVVYRGPTGGLVCKRCYSLLFGMFVMWLTMGRGNVFGIAGRLLLAVGEVKKAGRGSRQY